MLAHRSRSRRPLAAAVLAGAGLAALATTAVAADGAYSVGRAGFAVRVVGEVVPYRVFGIYVVPGEQVGIEVVRPAGDGTFTLDAAAGEAKGTGPGRWSWRAPAASGLYPLEIRRLGSDDAVRLNAFVMVPYGEISAGHLNGYRIGAYPATALRGLAIYRPPRGFVEVTRDNLETPVAPHFTLGQFLCKQAGGFPKYLALRERLLLKLEVLLEAVNQRGFRADTFFVMSGFRTPAYNAAIGNVKYSRHQWGGAADIFIDEAPRDGVMDDLNGDGRIDGRDADVLYDLFESLRLKAGHEPYVGGLGRYGNSVNHGPFVHVDARGFRARWGR